MIVDEALQLAFKHYQEGNLDQAEQMLIDILKIQPDNFFIYNFLGVIFDDRDKPDMAVKYYQKSIDINPNFAEAYNNLGIALKNKGQFNEAILCYEKSLELDSLSAEAHNNLGYILFINKCEVHKAISHFQRAIELNTEYAEAQFNLALTFLLSGNFKEGWKQFEWYWKKDPSDLHNFTQPLWDGAEVIGKTILLHERLGFGEAIMFIRYALLMAQSGAKVIVECQKELKSLMENVEGVYQVISYTEQRPNYDLHCPIFKLPVIFNTTLTDIPQNIPYIFPEQELIQQWSAKLCNDNSRLKIGIVWSAGHKKGDPYHRSCPFELFASLMKIRHSTFYSLQKEKDDLQIKPLSEEENFIDYTNEFNDFSDTAALIQNLDLIISVDTAVAHLAGALGKPVWILLPFVPDWRWLLNREDSPWYSTMRLFRQPSLGDWESVIAKVKGELLKLLGKH